MNGQSCKDKVTSAETGKTITIGIFDSSRVWKALLIISALTMTAAAISMGSGKIYLCVIFCVAAFILSTAGMIFSKRDSRVKFTVTDRCIYRKTFFGRHTYLPLDSVRAVDMMSFGGIRVRTAVGNFRCHLLKNNGEIFCTLKSILDEKQQGN